MLPLSGAPLIDTRYWQNYMIPKPNMKLTHEEDAKMADEIVVPNKSYVKSSINSNNSELFHCKKCEEVEYQLQQALEELSSAQLIIQMLKEESLQVQQCGH